MRIDRRDFIRTAILASGTIRFSAAEAAISSAAGISHEAPIAKLRVEFREPPKKFRPMVRWWWPGDDVTEGELRREIAVLDEAGFGAAEIQAFFKALNPSAEQKARINGFASESFFRHVAVAAEEARNRGMFIDYTFGSGWPFGGGDAITPELSAIELRSSHFSVAGPAQFRSPVHLPSLLDGYPNALQNLPAGWAERLQKRIKVVAVVAVRGTEPRFDFYQNAVNGRAIVRSGELEDHSSIDLTKNLQPDGVLQWDVPAGTWQVFVFCSVPTCQRVNAGAGEGPQLVMDHLNAEAFRAHAKRVGDNAMPYLRNLAGNGLRAVFCDSLEVRGNLFWCDDFLAQFARRRGYDLTPYLPILQLQTHAEPFAQFFDVPLFEIRNTGEKVRHDYRQTLSELMNERLYSLFNQWAHEHGLLTRTQAHGAPVDVLTVYGEADIPETEQLYDQGCFDFLKLASSAAHANGRSIVGCESFVWPTALYETTPEKMKRAADELFAAGINAIVHHGFAYRIPDLPPPGWHPFNGISSGNYSSQFNEANPLWPFFTKLNPYFTRLQYLSQTAKDVAAIALYRDALTHGAEELPPTPPLNQALLDAGYGYDHVNEQLLLQTEIRNGALSTPGGATYRALVLPRMSATTPRLAEHLRSLAAGGLPILALKQLPENASGLSNDKQSTQQVHTAIASLRRTLSCHVAPDIAQLVSWLKANVTPNVRFLGQPFPFFQKRTEDASIFFFFNDYDNSRSLNVALEASGEPELWDPWTGEIASLPFVRNVSGNVTIERTLAPFSSVLVVFSPNHTSELPPAPQPRHEPIRSIPLDAGWTLVASGMTSSQESATIRRNLINLVDWSLDPELRSLSGRGVYTTVFTAPSSTDANTIVLALGDVREVAEVKVNGKLAGTSLLRPHTVDITHLVNPGHNILEVTVTTTLFNAMANRSPRTFQPGPAPNSNGLMSAGLIGPVSLLLFK